MIEFSLPSASKPVALQPRNITIRAVNFFTRVMALLMLAFWMSALTACTTECAKLAQDDLCCPASGHGSDDPANPDSNCVFTVALIKIHDDDRVAWDFSLLPAIAQVLFTTPPDAESHRRISSPGAAQTLSREWQFITRTALPPRAPSFVS